MDSLLPPLCSPLRQEGWRVQWEGMLRARDLTFESLEGGGEGQRGKGCGSGGGQGRGAVKKGIGGEGLLFLRPLEVTEDEQCYGNLSFSCSNII